MIVLPSNLKHQIESEGVKAFPEECCGIMVGRDRDGKRVVERFEKVENEFEPGESGVEIWKSPAEFAVPDAIATPPVRISTAASDAAPWPERTIGLDGVGELGVSRLGA